MKPGTYPLACWLWIGLVLSPAAPVEPGRGEESVLGHFLTGGGVPDDELLPSLSHLYILRRDFDLTGDGAPEIFLTVSGVTGAYQRTVGHRWNVYRGGESTTAGARFLGTVSFHGDHVRVIEPDTLRVIHRKNVGLTWVVDFRWTGSEFTEIQRREFETGNETLLAQKRAILEFRKSGSFQGAWAELTPQGLGPWRDSETSEVVEGLTPIASPVLRLSSRAEPKSILSDLRDRLSCLLRRCELYLELADLTGDGRPELLFNSSKSGRKPRPVYAQATDGYRYLGDLPMGFWRLDDQGRISVVKSSPAALARYRVTSEEMTLLEELTLPDGRSVIDRERRAIVDVNSVRDRRERYLRITWEEAERSPEAPPWLTFESREPTDLQVDLSLPVVNLDKGGGP